MLLQSAYEIICLVLEWQPLIGHGLLIHEVSRSHTTTHQSSVGILWTSNQLVAETSSGRVKNSSQRPPLDEWSTRRRDLLWTSDQLVAETSSGRVISSSHETSTWQHTTLTTDMNQCPDGNRTHNLYVRAALDGADAGTGPWNYYTRLLHNEKWKIFQRRGHVVHGITGNDRGNRRQPRNGATNGERFTRARNSYKQTLFRQLISRYTYNWALRVIMTRTPMTRITGRGGGGERRLILNTIFARVAARMGGAFRCRLLAETVRDVKH
jgi:hypothetical protein